MASEATTSVSPGGVSLLSSLSGLMKSSAFTDGLWQRMSYQERQRLYALHQQACFGDAPAETTAVSTSLFARDDKSLQRSGLFSSLSWLDFSAKARLRRWQSLRGTMTAAAATEAFCAEFMALVEKYKPMALVPQVESALSYAQLLNDEEEAAAHSRENKRKVEAASAADDKQLVFCIRAHRHDPAAMALQWICRAYAIPHELALEGNKAGPNSSTGEPPLYAGVRISGQALVTEVHGPEASLQLLCDCFLQHMPHWAGKNNNAFIGSQCSRAPNSLFSGKLSRITTTTTDTVADELSPSQRAVLSAQRSVWLQQLQNISRHLREPIMRLVRDAAKSTSGKDNNNNEVEDAAISPRRRELLACAAKHFLVYQEEYVRQQIRYEGAEHAAHMKAPAPEREVVSPHLVDYTSATSIVYRSFQHRLVSCVDIYAACCAYVLCTSPYATDVFPLQRFTTSLTGPARRRSPAPAGGSAHAAADNVVHLAGVSKAANEALNKILQSESVSAAADGNNGAANKQDKQAHRDTVMLNGDVPALAVERWINSRLTHCHSPTLDPQDVINMAESPFMVLGHILARSWALGNEQCPCFPYLSCASSDSRRVRFIPCVSGGSSSNIPGPAMRGAATGTVLSSAWASISRVFGFNHDSVGASSDDSVVYTDKGHVNKHKSDATSKL